MHAVTDPVPPDPIMRLAAYHAAHPEVIIGEGGFGTWQAIIPVENGETVITRHQLSDLLDRLDALDEELDDTG